MAAILGPEPDAAHRLPVGAERNPAAGGARRIAGLAFRVVFALYAAGLAGWLVLGLLPTLADLLPVFRAWLGRLSTGAGPLAPAAGRILNPDPSMVPVPVGQALLQYGFSLLNGGLGVLLAVRRPDALVPRLLAFALVGTAATFNEPSHRAFHITGSPWPIALLHFCFHVVSGLCYLWAVLLFPDGRLPRRIRLPAMAGRATVLATTLLVAWIGWQSSFLSHPQFFVLFFGIGIPLAGVGAAVLRIRDARARAGEGAAERAGAAEVTVARVGAPDLAASRLLCAALLPALATAALWCAGTIAGRAGTPAASTLAGTAQELFPAVFAVVPVVLFAAVVRYRLWDIDRLLGRVLVYGVLGGLIGVGYVLAVTAGAVLAGGGLWWTVTVLSVTAVAVEPLRRAATRWANRVVYGQRISPAQAMTHLLTGLQQFSPAGGLQQVVTVTVQATRARSARLWALLEDTLVPVAATATGEFRPVRTIARRGGPVVDGETAATTADAAGSMDPVDGQMPSGITGSTASSDAIALSGSGLPADPSALTRLLTATAAVPVRYRGMELGVLAVSGNEPLGPTDRALLADLADHAGMLLHNSLLNDRLADNVEQLGRLARRLRAARRALVAAQDAERQRLERNLHDGAQQHLVAAIIALRTGDPAGAAEVLADARAGIRSLTTSQRAPALADGLAAALQRAAGLARRSAAAVSVRIDLAGMVDVTSVARDSAEEAVYYCCTEAIQNAVKYAGRCTLSIVVDSPNADIRFTVSDDGPGFDPSVADAAGGLARLAGRVGPLGGWVSVQTAPGRGTRVTGRIPVRDTEGAS